jgi:hypothetical protein
MAGSQENYNTIKVISVFLHVSEGAWQAGIIIESSPLWYATTLGFAPIQASQTTVEHDHSHGKAFFT